MKAETIQKIKEARARQSPPRPKGFKMSDDQKRKIGLANSLSLKGKKHTKEWKQNMSKIMKKLGNKPPSAIGRKYTKEQKQRMSMTTSFRKRKGVSLSEEHRNKIRVYQINNPNRKFKDTKIELKMQALLDKLGIYYLKQTPLLKVALVDFYLPNKNLVIQVDGCYWHGCPEHHPEWGKRREKDAKQDEVLQANGLTVIRFWEHEINSPNFIIKNLEQNHES